MSSIVRRGTMATLVALLALAGSVHVTGSSVGSAHHGKAAASAMNVDWPRFGNTTDNTRFSPLTQINASNVNKLGIAWTMSEGANLSVWETDPVVVNGTMYLTTNTDQVLAVNAATGKLLWKFTPAVNFYLAIAGGGGGVPTNRGVAVVNGKVYLLTFDARLVALQAATGEKLWSVQVANPHEGYSESSPPTYWNGLLFVGSEEGDAGLRGFVAAYDANTGKQVWRFYTIPAPGQGWNPAQGGHGGGDVWMPPTIDTRTGVLYFGTGNPSPDFMNTMRPGCNQWVDATVALDARTGKLLWAHTQVCPDVWDYDSHQPPTLFTVQQNGKTIRAVGQGNKEGYYWIFDARTGKVLAKSPALVPETNPRPFPNPKGVTICPGTSGGIEFSPAAYNPQTHAVYQPALNECQIFQTADPTVVQQHRRGTVDTGGLVSNAPMPRTGTMSAIDVNTGKLLWHDRISQPMIGGTLATAGNVVFSGADDGHFYAFDARTGKILWSPYLRIAFGAAPIAYEVNGTEYIAIAAGGADVSASDTAPLGGTFVVFKLGGATVKPLPAVAAGTYVPMHQAMPSLKGLTRLNPWMYVNAKNQHLVLRIVAAATPNDSGFNFDGYAKGQATFVVPQNWNVDFMFSNKAALPHSMAIASNLKLPPTLAPFGFGQVKTPDPIEGTGPGVTQVVGMSAVPAGKYYMVCLVPGHIQAGMWDYFTISATAKMPSIQTGTSQAGSSS